MILHKIVGLFCVFLKVSIAISVERGLEIGARIINGSEANILEFPFMVSMRYNPRFHWCGGTILSPDWILTAAHCPSNGATNLTVRYGSNNHDSGSTQVVKVKEVIIHEDFKIVDFGAKDDIALLRLASPIDMGEIENRVKLPFPKQYFPTGLPAVVTGWGMDENEDMPYVLQKVNQIIISTQDCRKLYSDESDEIFFKQICSIYVGGGKGACYGDSGGPLLVNGIQVGIVSGGKQCASKKFPAIYTGVTNYIDWIQEKTGLTFDLNFFLRSVN